MTGKQLFDYIRQYNLEKSKFVILDYDCVYFKLPLDQSSGCKYSSLEYALEYLNNIDEVPSDYYRDKIDPGYSSSIQVFRNVDEKYEYITISEEESKEYLKLAQYTSNDGEKLINYIKDNNLYDHIIVVDDRSDKLIFVKRVVIQDTYTFDTESTNDKVEREITARKDITNDFIENLSPEDIQGIWK